VTELVINAPELQTRRQRFGALAVAAAGWLLWAYFLFPVLELCGWWLDIRLCSVWVNLSGGYLGLTQLLQLYAATVGGLAGLWMLRVAYGLSGAAAGGSAPPLPAPVAAKALCEAFQLDFPSLAEGRSSRYVEVHFDAQGRITRLQGRGPETDL